MDINNLLAQGYKSNIEPYGNALMRAQEFKANQQRNALLQMQGEDMHAQRALALQQAQVQAQAQQQREAELSRLQGGGQLDPIALLRAGVPKDQIEFLANRSNLGRPEVARETERAGANGRPEKVFFDKFGNPVGQAMPQAVKMEVTDLGGTKAAYDPYGLLAGQQFKKTQTPDNVAQVGAQIRGQNMVDARSREATAASMSKPFEVTGPNGPVLVQQTKDGRIVPVDGYTPKTATDKPLAPAVVKNIVEARDNAATIASLKSSFKPEFAGKGVLGLGADMQMGASGNLGVDTDAVEWWKNYRKQAELIERHALFGAALTPTEQASWRSADIGPGMDSKVVARNLATREKLTKQVLEMARQDSIDAGHSESRVNAIAGRQPAGVGPAAGAVVDGYRFKGGNPADKANWEKQ